MPRPSKVLPILEGLNADQRRQVRAWVRREGYHVHKGECGRLVDRPDGVLDMDPLGAAAAPMSAESERVEFVWRMAAHGTVARLGTTLLHHERDKGLQKALSRSDDEDAGLRERYEELVREVAQMVDRIELLLGDRDPA